MKDWLSRKGSRLLDMMSQRRRLAKYADPGAHRRSAPDQDSRLPYNHTRTPPPMGPF
jgi:ribosomal protein S15P/S13E